MVIMVMDIDAHERQGLTLSGERLGLETAHGEMLSVLERAGCDDTLFGSLCRGFPSRAHLLRNLK
jgi:hypothetical protein